MSAQTQQKTSYLKTIVAIICACIVCYECAGDDDSYESSNIVCDGKTEYEISRDIYATGDEDVARREIDFIARNPNDNLGYLEFVAQNEWSYSHFHKGDPIVVLSYTFYGYRCRNLRTYKIGFLPPAFIGKKY